MQTQVDLVPEEALPRGGPALAVAPLAVGTSPLERYLHAAGGGTTLAAGADLAALVRMRLSTDRDGVRVTDAAREGRNVRVALEVRRFAGPLAASVPRTALVQVRIGALEPGEYELAVAQSVVYFGLPDPPGETADPPGEPLRLPFEVRAA